MAFRLEFSTEAERDFALIFDHLFDSYRGFGEPADVAFEHARARVVAIRQAAARILAAPLRGERHDDLLPGLRHLTIDRAIYWFDVEKDGDGQGDGIVRVLAVFFGGQDHVRHMLLRLLKP